MSPRAAALALALVTLVSACQTDDGLLPPGTEVAIGTWGGEDAGLLVRADVAHAHIGCTYGDFATPITLDREGRFSVPGSYTLRAYPVAVGPPHPATLSGALRGGQLTLSVVVNDTIEDELVYLGPVTVVHGREPRMGPCPICLEPGMGAALRLP